MGLRFHRSLKILPGIRLNFSGSGVSTSLGARGAHVTFGHGQVRETVGLPGTGVSYTTTSSTGHHTGQPTPSQRIALGGWLVVAFIGFIIFAALGGSSPRRDPLPPTPASTPAPTVKPVALPKMASPVPETLAELRIPMAVAVDALNERNAPDGHVVDLLHRGDPVDVFEQKDGWARVTSNGKPSRWVSMKLLQERRR